MFFSILPNEYERQLKEEIWGCFKHIGIPFDTIMSMPIQDRRFYIMKHNMEQEAINKELHKSNESSYNGNGDLNSFAQLEQSNAKVRNGQ